MRKFFAALFVALSLLVVALPAGGTGYIWGGGDRLGVNIPGGSYDTSDQLDNRQPKYQSFAVTAFQQALYGQGWLSYYDWAAENGRYGPKTETAVRRFQKNFLRTHGDRRTPDGLAVNGRIGPATSRALFQPYVVWNEVAYGIPNHRLHGLIRVESEYDPGAYNSGGDRGFVQFSPGGFPSINNVEATAQVIDAINIAARTIYNKFVFLTNRWGDRIGFGLRWHMASATWNAPTGSTQWSDCYVFTGDAFNDCGHTEVGVARFYGGVVGNKGKEFPN